MVRACAVEWPAYVTFRVEFESPPFDPAILEELEAYMARPDLLLALCAVLLKKILFICL